MRPIGTKIFGARYTAMKRDRTLRSGLLDGTFYGDLVGHPSGTDKIALNERNAMLQRELVNLLTIDNRDHDFVVANDALAGRRSKRQGVCAWTVDRFVVHRNDTEIALFISMANVIVA